MIKDLTKNDAGVTLPDAQQKTVSALAVKYDIFSVRDSADGCIKVYGSMDGKCKTWLVGQRGGCKLLGNYW